MTATEQTVVNCAAEAYRVDPSAITLETDIREDISNQSLKLVAFISGIEEELDVAIDIAEAGSLKTIRDFVDKVNELAG